MVTKRKTSVTAQRQLVDENEEWTELLQNRKELKRLNNLNRNILESITDSFVALDHEWRFSYINSAAEKILRKDRKLLIGKNIWESYPFLLKTHFYESVQQAIREKRAFELTDNFGVSQRWMEIRIFPSEDDITIYFHEITENKRIEQKLQWLAYHDELTKLANRSQLNRTLEELLKQASIYEEKVGVAFFDLDGFKNINDTLGHVKGDLLLKEVARRLSQGIREVDFAARMGGDEFILALPHLGNKEECLEFIEEIREQFKTPFEVEGSMYNLSASVGLALFPEDGEDAETLLKSADMALFEAKKRGRSQFQWYSQDLNQRILNQVHLEMELEHALENREFELFYQPQINTARAELVGFEALIRWNHPMKGMISPADFIPVAEQTGLIMKIGEWVVHEACQQLKTWQNLGYSFQKVAVNLSAQQFQQSNLAETIKNTLQQIGLSPCCLELEITESTAMKNIEMTVQQLKELRTLGIKVSIDDFGTGYSSLNYLKSLPIDALKIDQTFIREINRSSSDWAITQAIISLAQNLKMDVIAEGIETKEQRRILRELGCHKMQGYFFGRPVPPQEITAEKIERIMREV